MARAPVKFHSTRRLAKHVARPIKYQQRGPYNSSDTIVKLYFRHIDDKSAHHQADMAQNQVKRAKQYLMHNKLPLALASLAMIAFVVGSIIGISNLLITHKTQQKVAVLSSQSNKSDLPDETQPTSQQVNTYAVAPDLARLVIIPKLNVKARAEQVGVKTDNTMMAPNNIYDAGWYTGSAKPGQAGAVVVDGHVHGPTKPGVFADLYQLQAGDRIQIERGDHKLINYKVVKTKVYAANNVDMAAVLSSIQSNANGLNLITCTGSINYNDDTYNQRLVVFAVQQ